jgi:hypothetical protein
VAFVWFWTFWHWSAERFGSGALLRSPLQGIVSHWDEWYRHEASERELSEIEATGASYFGQRRFVCWLARRWAKEARWRDETLPARYVLAQLSHTAPFNAWTAFDKYRITYATPGVAAIILAERSAGEPGDVRRVESVALPLDEDSAAAPIVSDGFHADSGELSVARRAAMSLLSGKGLIVLLGLWLFAGARPYSRYLRILVLAAWLAIVGLMVRLLFGPDPGTRLVTLTTILFALWFALVVLAFGVAGTLTLGAWRTGAALRRRTEGRQLHIRMSDGLSVHGGSAGLAFCLNALLAVYRSCPQLGKRSWLWDRFFRRLRSASPRWAATGVVDADGVVQEVVLEPKIRACLRNHSITDLLMPWQLEARPSTINKIAASRMAEPALQSSHMALGFASTKRELRGHRCRHAAQAVMAVGDFTSISQLVANVFALAVSVVMVAALADIRNLLLPPDPPPVVAPGSPSPYYLWVSLHTNRPDAFAAELESAFWANRRANVIAYGGADGSARAEMRLTRYARPTTIDEEDGTVSIVRRRRFLGREFGTGERVGSYPFAHLTNLSHD